MTPIPLHSRSISPFSAAAINDRSNPDCYHPIGCPKPSNDVRMCGGECPASSSEGKLIAEGLLSWIHLPYFPAFHRPGWLFRYLIGPYDKELAQMFISDLVAGLTVAMTLVPQALSYAGLAGMPKVNGLYAAILPSATYVFFGTSMQLAVGPVAIVSLLMGALMAKYQPDYLTNTVAAVDTGAQASLNVGIMEAVYEARKLSVRIVIMKTRPHVTYDLIKRGIYNDASTPDLNLDEYLVR